MIMISSASAASVWDGKSVDTSWYDDSKREFTIDSAAQLAGVAALVNDGTTTFRDKTITLANDIDLNNHPWTPIGFGEEKTLEIVYVDNVKNTYHMSRNFEGVFNGGNHLISNLYIYYPASDNVGLFGRAGDWYADWFNRESVICTIKNLQVEATSITGKSHVGGVVGYLMNGEIDSVTMNAAVISGEGYVGGIVGILGTPESGKSNSHSFIRNVKVNVDTVKCSHCSSGGIVGQLDGFVENAEVFAKEIRGDRQIGGISGLFGSGSIKKCAVIGSVSGTDLVGGISGDVVSYDNTGRGIIGDCYFVGILFGDSVAGITSNLDVGSTIENCYVVGTIVGNEPGTGGIVSIGGDYSKITNSVSLIQYINSTSPNRISGKFAHKTKLHNNYAWDEMMSFDTLITEDDDSTSSRNGASISSENIWGNQALFERTLGWDFKNTWTMNSGNEKFNLPVLQFQEQPVNADAMYLYAEPVETPGFSPFLVILAFGLCIGLTTRRRK